MILFRNLPCRLADGSPAAIGIATLNAESTLNALSLDMIALLEHRLAAWEADPSIVLVMLEGAGSKAFCAGGDLQQLYQSMRSHHASPQAADPRANDYALEFFRREYALDYRIHTFAKPVLCWGHGIVMGGGIGLMAGASHRVVTEGSRLAMPEVAIGLYPDVGGSWFLNRMPGHTGRFLALTGASLNAADALFAKLADFHVPHGDKERLLDLLQLQAWSADAGNNHERLGGLLAMLQQAAQPLADSPLRRHFDLINLLCAGGGFEETVARITALQTDERWLAKAVGALAKGSPGAAWLAWHIQQRARHLSLADVFRLELGVSLAVAARPDFAEGIRALIIDKDQQPRWQPPAVSASRSGSPASEDDRLALAAWGAGFFTPLWPDGHHPLQHLGATSANTPERKAA